VEELAELDEVRAGGAARDGEEDGADEGRDARREGGREEGGRGGRHAGLLHAQELAAKHGVSRA